MAHAMWNWLSAFYVFLLALLFAPIAQSCDQPSTVREATSEEIRSFFKGRQMKVLTFLGYSAAEYEKYGSNRLADGKLPLCAEMCSTKALIAGDANVVADIFRERVLRRGGGAEVWGWDAAYGGGEHKQERKQERKREGQS